MPTTPPLSWWTSRATFWMRRLSSSGQRLVTSARTEASSRGPTMTWIAPW